MNANRQFNNNGRALGIAPLQDTFFMKTYNHLYSKLCSWENLEDAYWKARKHKTSSPKVQEFDRHWRLYLCQLSKELRTQTYTPKPLQKFVLRDPKTRVICVSNFRDRIVHHALVNILQPIFEPLFIYDSYASQKGKGNLSALKRFEHFLHRVTKNGRPAQDAKNNNQVAGFAFKADIRHYFDTVDHVILLNIIQKKVKDKKVTLLIQKILNNYHSDKPGKGMPLGNWTSQFFANIYLNELDQYVKHQLKAKHYIRYVDDFIILHHSKTTLLEYQEKILHFLAQLKLELHPNKCKIIPLHKGTTLLGFRIFYHYKLVKQRNMRKIMKKLHELLEKHRLKKTDHQQVSEVLQGWNAYAKQGNTYRFRQKLTEMVENGLKP